MKKRTKIKNKVVVKCYFLACAIHSLLARLFRQPISSFSEKNSIYNVSLLSIFNGLFEIKLYLQQKINIFSFNIPLQQKFIFKKMSREKQRVYQDLKKSLAAKKS